MSWVTAETPAMRAEIAATVGNNILTGLQLHKRTMNDWRYEDDWIQIREEDYILELVDGVTSDVREWTNPASEMLQAKESGGGRGEGAKKHCI